MLTQAPQLANAIPILRVADLAASLDYYTKSLGFKVDWWPAQAFTIQVIDLKRRWSVAFVAAIATLAYAHKRG